MTLKVKDTDFSKSFKFKSDGTVRVLIYIFLLVFIVKYNLLLSSMRQTNLPTLRDIELDVGGLSSFKIIILVHFPYDFLLVSNSNHMSTS